MMRDSDVRITDISREPGVSYHLARGQAIWPGTDLQGQEEEHRVYLIFRHGPHGLLQQHQSAGGALTPCCTAPGHRAAHCRPMATAAGDAGLHPGVRPRSCFARTGRRRGAAAAAFQPLARVELTAQGAPDRDAGISCARWVDRPTAVCMPIPVRGGVLFFLQGCSCGCCARNRRTQPLFAF